MRISGQLGRDRNLHPRLPNPPFSQTTGSLRPLTTRSLALERPNYGHPALNRRQGQIPAPDALEGARKGRDLCQTSLKLRA
uniref:Uncharacterized protein n=1 Tax=Brassica campestris TaxID=3711 RepID=M4ETR2_BRACM